MLCYPAVEKALVHRKGGVVGVLEGGSVCICVRTSPSPQHYIKL